MSDQEASPITEGVVPAPKKNKGGRPRKVASVAKQIREARKKSAPNPLPTPEAYREELRQIAPPQSTPDNWPWKEHKYRWVTIMRDPTKTQFQFLCLGDLPPYRVWRGQKVCLPIELFNVLVDTSVPVLKCDIETTMDPYNIQRWEEEETFHKYQDHGPATEEEFIAFIEAQRKLEDPLRRKR